MSWEIITRRQASVGRGRQLMTAPHYFMKKNYTIHIIEGSGKHVTHEVRQMATKFSVLFQGQFSATIFFN